MSYLTPAEVAERYRVTAGTVIRWINSGKIVADNIGTEKRATWRIPQDQLDNVVINRIDKPKVEFEQFYD